MLSHYYIVISNTFEMCLISVITEHFCLQNRNIFRVSTELKKHNF